MIKVPKILVLADDFTGAAEIAGIAHQFGLTVRLEINPLSDERIEEDVLIVDTNTRNAPVERASVIVADHLKKYGTEFGWIYKKLDSVLRGPIESELSTILKFYDYPRCLLIPANPSRKRTIENGKYYIGDFPINETDFRFDPIYPRKNADVLQLIIDRGLLNYTFDVNAISCVEGIIIPDIDTIDKIHDAVKHADLNTTLFAGGADLFKAVLSEKFRLIEKRPAYGSGPKGKKLFVIGSKTKSSTETIDKLLAIGFKCHELPIEALTDIEEARKWEQGILIDMIAKKGVAIMRPETHIEDPVLIKNITNVLAQTTLAILDYLSPVDEILIEGGETARSIIMLMASLKLSIDAVPEDGVVRFKSFAIGRYITTKPGSYYWPENILKHP